ncbi:NVEALA domain-containing protein [Parapedobacter koreensis]|uniref:NVEALA protein n=1 Tax=Parapedobacter koreensis TaxID=332977 RepID=A0A1H7F374_9SPHI|nr:NVEALA domain-containing protein [Parapedobacter koreensis]SEK19817.1 NVEALA protein [Parapedobacter koreensis]
MKKKILGGFAVAVIAAVAAFNVNFNVNEGNELSTISLANVEALAQSEGGVCVETCLALWGDCTTSTGATAKAPLVCVRPN